MIKLALIVLWACICIYWRRTHSEDDTWIPDDPFFEVHARSTFFK